jgi:hypothetical protein
VIIEDAIPFLTLLKCLRASGPDPGPDGAAVLAELLEAIARRFFFEEPVQLGFLLGLFAACAACLSLRAAFRVCQDLLSVFGFGFSLLCELTTFGVVWPYPAGVICQSRGCANAHTV